MTDTSKREELIEKARAAIKPSDSIELVRAFEYLAAEKAHTPTDDGHDGWCGCEKCEPDDEHGTQPERERFADHSERYVPKRPKEIADRECYPVGGSN